MEYKVYVSKDIREMDVVFNKNVDKNEIEKFENDCLEKISKLPLMSSLKEELLKRKWNFKIEIQHTELNLNNYCSYLLR